MGVNASSNGQLMKTSSADVVPATSYFFLARTPFTAAVIRWSDMADLLVPTGARTYRPVAALRPSTPGFEALLVVVEVGADMNLMCSQCGRLASCRVVERRPSALLSAPFSACVG